MFSRVIIAMVPLLFSITTMALSADQYRVGFKVLHCNTWGSSCTKERVVDVANGQIRTDKSSGDYVGAGNSEPYHREESISFADGTVVHRGDLVLFSAILDYELVKVTDIANGRAKTNWATGTDYRTLYHFFPYHPQSNLTLNDGSVIRIGDRVFMNSRIGSIAPTVTDLADGFVVTNFLDGKVYLKVERLEGYKPIR